MRTPSAAVMLKVSMPAILQTDFVVSRRIRRNPAYRDLGLTADSD
jgi:hypothetical protein